MKVKKVLAVVLSATMVLGCGLTALADNRTSDGGTAHGSSIGYVDDHKIDMTLPTVGNTTLDYVADPQRIVNIFEAQQAAKGVVTSDGSTSVLPNGDPVVANVAGIYFNTTSGGYLPTSERLRAINNGSDRVVVTVTVTAEDNANNIAFTTTKSSADASAIANKTYDTGAPSLYMAINHEVYTKSAGVHSVTTSGAAAIQPTTNGGSVTTTFSVDGTPENYEYATNGTNSFTYKKIDGISSTDERNWNYAEFYLDGFLSYTNMKNYKNEIAPELNITWSFRDPELYVSTNTISRSNNSLTLSLPNGVSVSRVTCMSSGSSTENELPSARYTISGTTMTFNADTVNAFSGGKFKIYFSDGTTETLNIQ